MLVEHAQPHCGSRQFYNGILDGSSHGVFHGRIVVHKDAQKTDAKQTNRNLLLSDQAQIDTKPQLEIYADDVKCTHGATIGQIEENALFYLRSRGIDEVSARRLLLMAFASECLDRMKEGPARTHVEVADSRASREHGEVIGRIRRARAISGRTEQHCGGSGMTTAAKKRAASRMRRRAAVASRRAARGSRPALTWRRSARDFPILRQKIRGKPLVYLDNAATSQKPQAVINAITRYYERDNANIHRGVHFLSEHATEEHEAARATIQKFLNAADSREIIFVRGATEAINLVAQTYGRAHIGAGDEVLITAHGAPLEHRALAVSLRRERAPSCASRRSTIAANCCSKSTRSCWARRQRSWPSRTFQTRLGRSLRSGA